MKVIIATALLGMAPLVCGAKSLPIDYSRLTVETRIDIIKCVIINEIDFKEKPLGDCLKHISRVCSQTIGMGFSFTASDKYADTLKIPISLKCKNLTVEQLLGYLGKLANTSIAFKDGYIVIGSP